MKIEIIRTGKSTAQANMDFDSALLKEIDKSPVPILHLYDWIKPSATYGYFSKPEELLDPEGIVNYSLDLGKRPTGGGIIFHLTDFAFSFLVPAEHPKFSLNTLENYTFVNSIVAEAIRQFSKKHVVPRLFTPEDISEGRRSADFCMARPTIYDIMIEGKKVGGAAQRQTRKGYLHQGSVLLTEPPAHMIHALLSDKGSIANDMGKKGRPILLDQTDSGSPEELREEFQNRLIKTFLSG